MNAKAHPIVRGSTVPLRAGMRVRTLSDSKDNPIFSGVLALLSHSTGNGRTRLGPPRSPREQWAIVAAVNEDTKERVGRVYARADELEVLDA